MSTKSLGKYRALVIFTAIFLGLSLIALYFGFEVYRGYHTGVISGRRGDATLSDEPGRFWFYMTFSAAGAIIFLLGAIRAMVIARRMHKKGLLLVRETSEAPSRERPALIDPAKISTLDAPLDQSKSRPSGR
jgi:hypothetical protein